jgi:hypothetical protein
MLFRLKLRLFSAALSGIVVSCLLGGCIHGDSAAPPAGGIIATPGEGQVTITWTAEPGVEYWLVYAATASISATPPPTGAHTWVTNVTSPYIVTGLTNGTTYSFAMNGRTGGGPGGPSTPSVSAIPRPAGGTWTKDTSTGGQMGAYAMSGIAYDGTANYVSVSSDGAIFKGTVGAASSIIWTSPPTATANLNAVTYRNSTDGFVAVGTGGYYQGTDLATASLTSTGGITWNAVATNGTQTVMVGNSGNILHSDSVGGVWSTGSGATGNLYGVAYIGTNWIAVGASGAIFTSSDGNSWGAATGTGSTASDLRGVASYGAIAVATGASGAVVTSSDSGATWAAQTVIAGTPTLNAVNVSSDQILVVASGGQVFTSPLSNVPTWTVVPATSTNTTSDLKAVIGSSMKYFAVGAAGTSIWSQ